MTRLHIDKHLPSSALFWCVLAVALRFITLPSYLYFIWDQGYDAVKVREILTGDLTLLGPSTGLAGVYLGPLWLYIGVPGFILGQGNPYIFAGWYIALSLLSFPLFWMISRALFARTPSYWITFLLLLFVPASLTATTFVWNPLLSVPLTAAMLLCVFKARTSRLFLFSAVFFCALILQSEFAYGVFLVPSIFVLIPWIRQRVSFIDFLLSAMAFGITLIPQFVFELTHNFIMTKTLITHLLKPESTTLLDHLQKRAIDLIASTGLFFTGVSPISFLIGLLVLSLITLAILNIFSKKPLSRNQNWMWRVVSFFAVVPYIGFLLWRGNEGNFFWYYLTAHFIIVVPLIVYGTEVLITIASKRVTQQIASLLPVILACLLFGLSIQHAANAILFPENKAGLRVMEQGIDVMYDWADHDDPAETVFRIFTPNQQTEHYDHLSWWIAKKRDVAPARTIRRENDIIWYVLSEPDYERAHERFLPWYRETTKDGLLVRRKHLGVLVVETWMYKNTMEEKGLKPFVVKPTFEQVLFIQQEKY